MPRLRAGGSRAALALVACATAVAAAPALGDTTSQGGAPLTVTRADASATLEQCVTALTQAERSTSFAGEMSAVPGTARMEISIGLTERLPEEVGYHLVSAPGLGAWRGSAPGVKTYTYIKQVTDLSAPAFYRGVIRFRWLNSRGRTIKVEEIRTPRCEQPAPPAAASTPPAPEPTPPAASS